MLGIVPSKHRAHSHHTGVDLWTEVATNSKYRRSLTALEVRLLLMHITKTPVCLTNLLPATVLNYIVFALTFLVLGEG